MKGKGSSTADSSVPEELEVTVIKKSGGVCSQEIKMKLPNDTTFGNIIKFMNEQGLLKTKNAIVRPSHNENHIIGHGRHIYECYNIIKLHFIIEEVDDLKNRQAKMHAFQGEDVQSEATEATNICGREQCSLM